MSTTFLKGSMRALTNQHRGANRRRAKAHVYKHPPPIEIFIGVKFSDLESRGSWQFKHPPPSYL